MRVLESLHRPPLWTILAATMLAACTGCKVQSASPEQLIASQQPSAVRVQRQDGSRVVMKSPRIVSDSLLGLSEEMPTSIPLGVISKVEVRRLNVLSTLELVAGVVALVVYVGVSAARGMA
jgi:hypothetical protein